MMLSCTSTNEVIVENEMFEINHKLSQVPDSMFLSKGHVVLTDNSVPIGNIDRLYSCNDTIYILDDTKDEVIVFNKDGKCIRTINRLGNGHGEYIQLLDFAYDKSSETLLFLVAPSAINIYSKDGTFQSKINLSDYYSNISVDSNFIYLYHVTHIEGKKCEYLVDALCKESGKLIHLMDLEKEYAPYCSIGNMMFNNNGKCHFVRKFDRNIYELSNGEVSKTLYAKPDKFTFELEDNDKTYDCSYLTSKCLQENKIYAFTNIVHSEKNLMLSTNLWDIVIKNDSTCERYSKVLNTQLGITMRKFLPVEGNSDYDVCFYLQDTEIDSIKKIIQKNKSVQEKMNKDFLTLLDNVTEPYNPILILYKLKD